MIFIGVLSMYCDGEDSSGMCRRSINRFAWKDIVLNKQSSSGWEKKPELVHKWTQWSTLEKTITKSMKLTCSVRTQNPRVIVYFKKKQTFHPHFFFFQKNTKKYFK